MFKSLFFKNRLYIVIALLSFIFVFNACDDSVSQPEPDDTEKPVYFPMKIGNYWVYNSTEMDKYNKTISTWTDSVVITGTTNLYDREAFVFEKYADGELVGTDLFYEKNNKVYTILIDTVIPVDNLDERWTKVFDFTNDRWNTYDTLIYDYPYDFEDTTWYGKGNFILKGKQNGFFEFQDKQALEQLLIYDSKITFFHHIDTINFTKFDSIFYETILRKETDFRLVDSVGLVYKYIEPYYSFIRPITLRNKEFNGLRSELVRYNVSF